ncbi:MAG: PAS domain-containing sensor histidine kinase [Bryobacteraceae bacterium]
MDAGGTAAARAHRAPHRIVERQAAAVISTELLRAVLDASPSVALVLNSQRQIVYWNRALASLIGVENPASLLGMRPGEALGCVNAAHAPGGCGTAEACEFCGALLAILDALGGAATERECRVTRRVHGRTEALDLAVHAAPAAAGAESFLVVSLADISHEKRRRALERIFFHDLLNTASCVLGLAEVIERTVPEGKARRSAHLLHSASMQLVNEIISQRTLAAAETGELEPDPEPLSSLGVLRQEVERYCEFPVAHGREIEIEPDAADVILRSDRALLGRVIGNMLANALEACPPGGTVRAGCRTLNDEVEFWVQNPAVMPEEVRAQVFQRSFSTKGSGRGLGTYSMKLLTERYLEGGISFTSNNAEGTTFRAAYPREPASFSKKAQDWRAASSQR